MNFIRNYLLPFRETTPLDTLNEKRYCAVYERVKEIAGEMRHPAPEKIWLGMAEFSESPFAVADDNRPMIYIPPMFLLDPSEIPSEFKGDAITEAALKNPHFINQFVSWLNIGLSLPELTFDALGTFQREQVVLFLKTLQDPKLYRRARDFVLAHEIAHLYLKHSEDAIPFWNVIGRIKQAIRWRNHEKDADILAAKTLNDKEGGIYLFKKFQDHFKAIRNAKRPRLIDRIFSLLFFTADGNMRFANSDHPTEAERVDYLSRVNLSFKLTA